VSVMSRSVVLRRALLGSCAALTLHGAFSNAALGQVAVTGDVDPNTVTNPIWNVGGDLRVGVSGSGTLTIDPGGSVISEASEIGSNSGSIGTVIVNGAGSSWTTQDLLVGNAGNGTLTIGAGAVVSAASVTIGVNSGSVGTVNLDGGALETAAVIHGAATSATLNFNGGVLRATAAAPNFLQNFTGGITVASGGAFIDTNGFGVGISTSFTGSGSLNKRSARAR
jgi:T5SS/PEP-CTERM-associated repeat protein